MARIHNSKSWKLIIRYYMLRNKILPNGMRRYNAVRLIWRSIWYLYRNGMRMFLKKAYGKIRGCRSSSSINDYLRWILEHEPTTKQLTSQKGTAFSYMPKISLIVPLWNTPEKFLHEMIKSVQKQTYANWELCLADGGSSEASVSILAREYAADDPRIRFTRLDNNKGIVGNSNVALSLATGDYVAFLDHDDLLPRFCLFEVAKAINEHPEVELIYSDEDLMSENSKQRFEPHFKPEFCPDTLRSYNYICHLTVVKKSLLDELGGFCEGYDGSQDYDLILRITEKAKTIIHIPKVLYHWRVHPSSLSYDIAGKLIAIEAAKKALSDHLHRLGVSGVVEPGLFLTSYKICYALIDHPLVSIIVPTKNNYDFLKTCINSILAKTTYKNYEVLLVDTGSTKRDFLDYYKELTTDHSCIHLLTDKRPFNYSAVNNLAVTQAKGDILLFLNNDVEVINADWIERMLEHAQRQPVGAVGAKLYFADGRIQHGGIIVGLYGVAGHSHRFFPREALGYVGRLQVTQNLSAVTGACLMMRRKVFEEVGGFDDRYSFDFNDVDLCLKIIEKNYRIVWTPYAELYHHEAQTRGREDTPEKQKRLLEETILFKNRWKEFLKRGDPCYSPNLTLNREDFSINTSS